MNTALATVPKKTNLIAKFANKFSVDEGKVMDILKSTAFKQRDGNPPSDEQMMALLIVADQYGLNPFVKEIYAYPDKSNGIVPVVGVDGWSRIMNDHEQMDGIEFRYSEETVTHKGKNCHVWIECIITRKDRSKPIVVREYFDEVVRSVNFTTPWDTHPKRMHRHKAEIQAVRIAFGFAGIYDEDEAERIIEKDITNDVQRIDEPDPQTVEVVYYTTDEFQEKKPAWKKTVIEDGKDPERFILFIEARGKKFTEAQKEEIKAWKKPDDSFVADMEDEEKGGAK